MTTRAKAATSASATVAADAPWAERLPHALTYPLRGAALAALIILPFVHQLGTTRGMHGMRIGLGGLSTGGLVWTSAFMYALECLRRTGNGFANPPEVTLYANYAPGIALLIFQVLGIAATVLAALFYPGMWLLVILMTLLLPSMTMSLAFEDSVGAALRPSTLARSIIAFGPAYLLPVGIGILQQVVFVASLLSHSFLGGMLWFAIVMYLLLLNFHLMGVLVHRYHERIGHTPEADVLDEAYGRHDDTRLLDAAEKLAAQGEVDQALQTLQQRLHDRMAPDTIHRAYRHLLTQAGRTRELRDHAQTYIASLLAKGEARRALGIVQASMDADPSYIPTAPEHCAQLADAAVKYGMPRLALKLARCYPNTWPRAPKAAHYGLLAATLLADHLDRGAEAGVLASKLLKAYPDDPARAGIEQLLSRLNMLGDTAS